MIGIDLVKIRRIETFMERFGDRALSRFLTPEEMLLVRRASTAAGFWAAKEACSKALGCGISSECGFLDIKIAKDSRGKPLISLSDAVRERFNVRSLSLSITHDGDYAIAVVALELNPAQ